MDHSAIHDKPPEVPHPSFPIVLSSFVGRQRELSDLTMIARSARLSTLTGAAGCGKTRLALHVASTVGRFFPDGAVWVELTQVADPALIAKALAVALRVRESPDRPLIEALTEYLNDKSLLLVLDNCEHVLEACVELVNTLLNETAVSIIATSREPLGVEAEKRYPVAPLSLPPEDVPPDDAGSYDAVRLFVERAEKILPQFALMAENAALVTSICRRLDGIPLAIELASARVNVLTLEQIAARLDDQFALLDRKTVLARTHHRTLYAAVDWSYELLSAPEQALLRRLSVFAGGCSLRTMEDVCVDDCVERQQVLNLLSLLVDKSLVLAQTLQRGEARYSLLETIRQFGREKLKESDEWASTHDRHLYCFLRIVEETAPKLQGKYQQQWLDWLNGEYDNVRAALAWSLESDHIEAGLRIANALYEFWTVRDYANEGLEWFDRLIRQAGDDVPLTARTNAVAHAGLMAGFRGNAALQMEYGHRAAELAEHADETGKRALMWALVAISQAARGAGDCETELTIARQVIEIERELEDTHLLGISLSTYSTAAMLAGDYAAAHAMLDEGLTLVRASGDPYRVSQALNYAGDLARCEGDYRRAKTAYEECISLLRECDAVRDLASALHNLGYAMLHLGDIEQARQLFDESLALQQSHCNEPGIAECLAGYGALAIECGVPGAGARLLASAVAIGGQRIATAWPATRIEFEHFSTLAQRLLGEAAFEREQVIGRALPIDDAVAFARKLSVRLVPAAMNRDKADELTARERDVAALIALGKTNGEIADELFISKRTVEKHVAHIMAKFQVANRTGIVRRIIESGVTIPSL